MNTTNYIRIFRGDDSDALGYQTIVGTIKTDLDLTGCKAVFRFLGFYAEFDPIPEDKKLTIVIPAQASRGFPPGVGYASLKVLDSLGKIRTFTNRIPVIVDTMTPSCGCGEFEVSFSPFPELEPLKIFVGPNADDFDQYTGFVSKIIDRASLVKYGLVMLADAMSEDGGNSGKAASPAAVKAAYDAIIATLTDNYYTSEQTEEAIDRVAAYYITYDVAGNPFPTYAALANATTVYSGGKVRIPTRNDYCVVLADETHQGAEYRYIYAVAEGQTTGSWQPQFPVEGVMTVDQTVMKNSQNPVSGGGVWKALWGALAALPAGFSSLYDWCVAQLAGKVPTSRTINSKALSSDVTLYADDVGALPAAHNIEGQYDLTNVGIDDLNLPSGTYVNGKVPILSGDVVAPDSSATSGKVADAAETYQALDAKQDTLSPAQLANIAAVPNKANDSAVVHKNGDTMTGPLTMDKSVIELKDSTGYKRVLRCTGTGGDFYIDYYDSQGTSLYSLQVPSVDGTLALTAGLNHTGNLAALDANGNPTDSQIPAANVAVKGNIPYALGTPIVINEASSEVVGGETVYYGAATLANRTANIVQVTAATALDELRIAFPAATNGKVRDFGLRVEIGTGSAALTAPALVPIAPTGETIKIENNAAEIPALADGTATAKGVTLLYFSENAPGVFVVKGEQVEEVA